MAKILWLTDNYYPNKGGMAESCDRITHNLRRAGAYIEVVHFHRKQRPLHAAVVECGAYTPVLVFPDPEHALAHFWHSQELRLRAEGFTHVVIFGGNYAMSAGSLIAAWLDIKLVTCLRGNDFDIGIFSQKRQAQLLETLRRSSAVCTVTDEKRARVQALLPDNAIYWTPNGVCAEEWHATECEQRASLDLKKIAKGRRIVGLFGHLKQKKGLDFLLRLIARNALQEQLFLMLAGELDAAHEEMLEQLGIHYHRLPFVGRYELIPHYLACDVVAIPSFYEGMPNVLIEAGALGKPFWCSTAGGMGDVLTDETAWLFPPGDARAARRALLTMLKATPEELASKGEAVRHLLETKYTTAAETNRYLTIFNQ